VWEFPGTEEDYCEELLVVPHIKTFKECFEYCREVMGGPPACVYFKFDPITNQCYPSPTCDNILMTPLSHGDRRELRKLKSVPSRKLLEGQPSYSPQEIDFAHAASEIVQLHCSFVRDLYETCLWTDLTFGDSYIKGYVPKYFGWATLKETVMEAEAAAAQGLQYSGKITSGEQLEIDIGLPRCYHECSNEEGCGFFAYSESLMACVMLG
jgi:hypothetical protein